MSQTSLDLHVRPVTDADLPAICAFSRDGEELFFWYPKATFPLSPSQLGDAIEQRSDSTVVELDGRVVAFANFYRWARGGICSIGNMVVCPTARGRGVARRLVEEMVAAAFARHGAAEVTVSCFNANVAGLLVYPRLGFQPYAIEPRQDRNGKPVALIHLRRLRSGSA
jgi:RimJ/RimL family protein N-acetyltransferase